MDAKPSALILTGQEGVCGAVERAGHAVLEAKSAEEAMALLREDRCSLVVLDRQPEPEIFSYLNALAGKRRRRLFLALVDASVSTGDSYGAWCHSADLVVAPADLGRFAELVQAGQESRQRAYRGIMQVAAEPGARLLGAHT